VAAYVDGVRVVDAVAGVADGEGRPVDAEESAWTATAAACPGSTTAPRPARACSAWPAPAAAGAGADPQRGLALAVTKNMLTRDFDAVGRVGRVVFGAV
jgi:hypothetical protein